MSDAPKKKKRGMGVPFKKGNPGKPKGAVHDLIPKVIKNTTRKQLAIMVDELFFTNVKKDIKAIKKDPTTTNAELAIIKVIEDVLSYGDLRKLEFLHTCVMGKERDSLEITNPDGNLNKLPVIILPANGREKEE